MKNSIHVNKLIPEYRLNDAGLWIPYRITGIYAELYARELREQEECIAKIMKMYTEDTTVN